MSAKIKKLTLSALFVALGFVHFHYNSNKVKETL